MIERPGEQRPEERPSRPDDEEPLLPDVTRDERDRGWGDDSSERDLDWYQRERPPHHE